MPPESQPLNLDKIAADMAQKIIDSAKNIGVSKPVESVERLATKALGVLQEQGVYAMMLFLFSRSRDEHDVAPCIRAQLFETIEKLPKFKNDRNIPKENSDAKEALQFYINNILDDLDTLLLVRDLYEQMLIYTRYAAKAAKAEQEQKGGKDGLDPLSAQVPSAEPNAHRLP